MTPFYYISVWLHIVCAAFWIGGMLFLPLVLLPGIKNNPERSQLLMITGLKFRFYGYIVLSILLLTGILNMYFRGINFSWEFFTSSHYGKLVIVKVILFLSILLVSLIHDLFVGRKAVNEVKESDRKKLKLIARWTGRILLLISLTMAYLGVVISRGG
ncbi:MAG TPA: CopD family protein [Chitinophagaceae bacterium]|jgi:putative copper export protein|nr:CopD family protein [Chitinophagaceae bacterium]